MAEEVFDTDPGEGIDLALSGDFIRKRHIATRASNKRMVIVLTVEEGEFEGYSIGIDENSLQILELPSGEVSTVALKYIVSISDSKPFASLTPELKDIVDRRTSSFRKTSEAWLVENWPKVYDKRGEEDRSRASYGRPVYRYDRSSQPAGSAANVDQEVRN